MVQLASMHLWLSVYGSPPPSAANAAEHARKPDGDRTKTHELRQDRNEVKKLGQIPAKTDLRTDGAQLSAALAAMVYAPSMLVIGSV